MPAPQASTVHRTTLLSVAALVVALSAGCAASRKAYDDRIGWLVDGKPPTIHFGCNTKPVTRLVDWQGREPIPVFAPGLAESAARLAGDLVRWRIGDRAPLAVNIEGPPAEEVLAKDVVNVLAQSGFLLVGGPAAGVLILTAAIAGVSVDTVPGGLLSPVGKTQAAVDFVVKLAGAQASKELSFKGQHAFSALSALASSPETTVNNAYCAGLQTFADTVALPDFVRDMREIVALRAPALSLDSRAALVQSSRR
jgi:hypothetical protein